MAEALVWERFEWKGGADRYTFEIAEGGLFGTMSAYLGAGAEERASPTHRLTLPLVAWEGLIEAMKTNRNARAKPVSSGLPARAGARWSDSEISQLQAGFSAGRRINDLARDHGRTPVAIEHQLERLGLWMRDHGEPPRPPSR